MVSNSNGQVNIFLKQKIDQDWEDFMVAVDEFFGVVRDPEVPAEKLAEWIGQRCMTRKTRDDWAGVYALHRDFMQWSGESFTRPSFEAAVTSAGYAIHRGMISKLLLKEDWNDMQVWSPKNQPRAAAADSVSVR